MESPERKPDPRADARRPVGRPGFRWPGLIAALLTCGAAPARGEEAAERWRPNAVLFSSLEAAASTFSTSGAKIAFDRFDRDGPVALVSVGSGVRLEGGGRLPVLIRTTALGAALGGYQFLRDGGSVAIFVGPEASIEMLAGPEAGRVQPLRAGLRLHGEVWARPSATTLATATLILGSARGDAWGRLSWGWSGGDALSGAYLGPEIALYADRTGYRKWGIGLHATDLALGKSRFRLSAGCQFEDPAGAPGRAGPYLSLAIWNDL
ncbi:cellulose biosynthesis protein BcsS [Methylobacterium sp. Leaf118]|uniref:cellulose biosynthesis protein BcsS n=1 Tax=Methylobacterium sp. Leaf118 TaxID=2876562 RepID=UPI001E4AC34B|nr:cellulose biosynthesis protein BcsS [Methylobacterium sp. Leaf118]